MTVDGAVRELSNTECRLVENPAEYAKAPLGGEFDVVIIDGEDRVGCAETAIGLVATDGLVVLDNSEYFWGLWSPGPSYPIIDTYNEAGFGRIDFHGYTPGVFRQQCTSLFFATPTRFRGLPPPPRKYPVGVRRQRR